jgi:peptidoglycan/xylan/chitin deacetylase (PgdA/CDA1 family)
MGAYILYYHRIFPNGPAPDVTLSLFEWEMAYLRKRYQVLSLMELLEYLNGDFKLDRPGVVITFDDGWFDNFVYAWPVLKKYGLKATIFVSTGKIRSDSGVRPTIEDCRGGRTNFDSLQKPKSVEKGFIESLSGDFQEFLTWEELRVMQKSLIFDIQSHGVEHRKIFCSDQAEGTVKGKIGWSLLSASPEIKEGVSLYPLRSSLAARAYSPDGQGIGSWETEVEMRRRILGELIESRDRITSEIGDKPLHLCWPWGQYCDAGIELAKEAGYEACYTTKAGTISKDTDIYRIPRVSTSGGKLTFVKRSMIYSNPLFSKAYGYLTGRR